MRTMIKTKSCVICGEDFEVEIREDGKILTECFYNPTLLEDYGVEEYWECTDCCNDEEPIIKRLKLIKKVILNGK